MKTISNAFISCEKGFHESDIVVFGVPYDGTSSFRPGSRFAPDRIRDASYALETYDPYFQCNIENKKISDVGNVSLPFGDKTAVLDNIKSFVKQIIYENKKIAAIGGEHLISLPLFEETNRIHSRLKIIHLDAHADLRDEYLGEKMSHATVVKNMSDIAGFENIYHYGIRSGTEGEFKLLNKHNNLNKSPKDIYREIGDSPVYLTVDLDILDTSVLPGTGTPEPGGLTFNQLNELIHSFKDFNIVAADMVELSPDYDSSGVSTIVAAKIFRNILCIL